MRDASVRGMCETCGIHPQLSNGKGKYKRNCNRCNKARFYKGQEYKTLIPRDNCSKCGFIPVHPCQIDIDHIDGNHKNNEPDNLQALCANCHRLKTYEAQFK